MPTGSSTDRARLGVDAPVVCARPGRCHDQEAAIRPGQTPPLGRGETDVRVFGEARARSGRSHRTARGPLRCSPAGGGGQLPQVRGDGVRDSPGPADSRRAGPVRSWSSTRRSGTEPVSKTGRQLLGDPAASGHRCIRPRHNRSQRPDASLRRRPANAPSVAAGPGRLRHTPTSHPRSQQTPTGTESADFSHPRTTEPVTVWETAVQGVQLSGPELSTDLGTRVVPLDSMQRIAIDVVHLVTGRGKLQNEVGGVAESPVSIEVEGTLE